MRVRVIFLNLALVGLLTGFTGCTNAINTGSETLESSEEAQGNLNALNLGWPGDEAYGGNGNGYDGKVFVSVDPENPCPDHSHVRSAFVIDDLAAGERAEIIREECQNIPPKPVSRDELVILGPNQFIYQGRRYFERDEERNESVILPEPDFAPQVQVECIVESSNILASSSRFVGQLVVGVVAHSDFEGHAWVTLVDAQMEWQRTSAPVPVRIVRSPTGNSYRSRDGSFVMISRNLGFTGPSTEFSLSYNLIMLDSFGKSGRNPLESGYIPQMDSCWVGGDQ
ncbi:MAG: hypothetical protein AB7G93_01365 [Bdellovibrionales bacterium]